MNKKALKAAFQFHTVRLRHEQAQVEVLAHHISIPHSPIEAEAARPVRKHQHQFQFHTVRLRHYYSN